MENSDKNFNFNFSSASLCGDALGSNTEFKSMSDIQKTFGYVRDFKHSSWRPRGQFTDDGESLLALATGIVECGKTDELDVNTIVRHYTTAFASEPRRGYGPTSSRILQMLASGQTTPDKSGRLFFEDGSYSNGCYKIYFLTKCFFYFIIEKKKL